MRRVAVTGLGSISSLALDAEGTWKALLAGQSGVSEITRFDTSQFKTRFAAEVKNFNPENYMEAKRPRTMDLFIQYAIAAGQEALLQSGLISSREGKVAPEIASRFAAIIGCGLGGLPTIEEYKIVEQERGPSRITPFFIPKLISNLAPGQIAIDHGLKGPNFAVTSACSSGAHALGEAYRMIKFGVVDYAVAGGTEAVISPLCVGGFNAMRALSTRNEEPVRASRPFDKDRDGFVVGEGCGLMVLEDYERAQARGATILAELVGYAANADAHHLTAPLEDGSGAAEVMRLALQDAGLEPSQVLSLNAHGTSTPLGDVAETKAIKKVFGDHAYKMKIVSSKSMIGHTLGAAGGLEAVICVQSLRDQKIHPTINLENPDPECDLDYVPHQAQSFEFEYALSNSFGFGGTNASLIFRKVL